MMDNLLKNELIIGIGALIDKCYAADRFPIEEECRKLISQNKSLEYDNQKLREENKEIKSGKIYTELMAQLNSALELVILKKSPKAIPPKKIKKNKASKVI